MTGPALPPAHNRSKLATLNPARGPAVPWQSLQLSTSSGAISRAKLTVSLPVGWVIGGASGFGSAGSPAGGAVTPAFVSCRSGFAGSSPSNLAPSLIQVSSTRASAGETSLPLGGIWPLTITSINRLSMPEPTST